MSKLTGETNYFINELHAAVDAHLDWVSRVLSYTVLGKSPSDDVLDPLAHTICQFGRWFALNKLNFEKLDAQKTQRLVAVHQKMHEAIRTICTDLLAGRGGESADLDVFDQMQSEFIHLLSEFETQILAFQSEPLPWALTWSEHLSVNIPAIDAEHQHFIQLSNELNEVITHGNSFEDLQKCIQSLVDDAGGHFYHEESMFRERGYPEAGPEHQISRNRNTVAR